MHLSRGVSLPLLALVLLGVAASWSSPVDALKVIGAGLPRTGTATTKKALEILGFGPCYHMFVILEGGRSEDISTFVNASKGQEVDFRRVYKDFNSAVDFPTAMYYKELMQLYPEAKVVLTVRKVEDWHESVRTTIREFSRPGSLTRSAFALSPYMTHFLELADSIWNVFFEGRIEDREWAIGKYHSWVAEVKRSVPAEKLLVFDVREGWEPLCKFLGVAVPQERFPDENSGAEVRLHLWLAKGGIVLALAAVAAAAFFLVRRLYRLVSPQMPSKPKPSADKQQKKNE